MITLLIVSCIGATAADAAQISSPPEWDWPLHGQRHVIQPYRAPAHAYGPGHRGVDLRASRGSPVYAPADGVIAFRGTVVDRPLLTIDHGAGYITTFEPVHSEWKPGQVVEAGTLIGVVDTGGHTVRGALHLGVRRHGSYINPMLLFGSVPRAVLLPCCAPL